MGQNLFRCFEGQKNVSVLLGLGRFSRPLYSHYTNYAFLSQESTYDSTSIQPVACSLCGLHYPKLLVQIGLTVAV